MCSSKDAWGYDYPYNVIFQSISYKDECNGALISDRWVISTYDVCVSKMNEWIVAWIARVGSVWKNDGSGRLIEKIVKHEKNGASSRGPVYDIALIKVKEPFNLDKSIQPIELFNEYEKLTPGTMAKVSGWGWYKDPNKTSPSRHDRLHRIEVPIMNSEVCKHNLGLVELRKGWICAGYRHHSEMGFYVGDEGFPLVIDGRLAALVSRVSVCSDQGRPTLCTEIAFHRPWIDKHAFGLNSGDSPGDQLTKVFFLLLAMDFFLFQY